MGKEASEECRCHKEIAKMVKEETEAVLDKVLYEVSCKMKNGFSRSDA